MPRRRRLIVLASVAVAIGALSWLWGERAWPGHGFVRGHVGDVGAAALVYAAFGVLGARREVAAALAGVVAVGIEFAQCGSPPAADGAARALVFGAHFDPWDLLAYAVGVVAAAAADRR